MDRPIRSRGVELRLTGLSCTRVPSGRDASVATLGGVEVSAMGHEPEAVESPVVVAVRGLGLRGSAATAWACPGNLN